MLLFSSSVFPPAPSQGPGHSSRNASLCLQLELEEIQLSLCSAFPSALTFPLSKASPPSPSSPGRAGKASLGRRGRETPWECEHRSFRAGHVTGVSF